MTPDSTSRYSPLRVLAAVRRRLGRSAAAPSELEARPGAPAAFAEPGWRIQRILRFREDLRKTHPLCLTPQGRRRFRRWLLRHGRTHFGITPAECHEFFQALDRKPDRGLVLQYQLNAQWQRDVPDALTPQGWPEFLRYLVKNHGLRGRWTRAVRPSEFITQAPLLTGGINVHSHFSYVSGLQEAAKGVVKALHAAGVPSVRTDLPVSFTFDPRDIDGCEDEERFDVTLLISSAQNFPENVYRRAGRFPRPGILHLAMLYWELDQLPVAWHPHFAWADEIWAPTRFIAQTFKKAVTCPVHTMLPGYELPPFEPLPRGAFGLPPDRFIFLFSFDMVSVMTRKNPLAAVEAFRRAFRPDDKVHLVIKTARGGKEPGDFARLRAACDAAGVQLIDAIYPREKMLALLHAADAYVSPHRSEGLGLGMAESMLLAKPTLATGYSGNLDFMSADASHLVNFTLVDVEPPKSSHNPYPALGRWADVDIDHLAHCMRAVYDDQPAARALGMRARAHIEQVMSPAVCGQRMKARLAELNRTRAPQGVTRMAPPTK